MRRAGDPAKAAGAGIKARLRGLAAGDAPSRLDALLVIVAAGLLSGLLLSPNLWFPAARTFPRAPLGFAPPPSIVPAAEYVLAGLLVAALAALLAAVLLARRPALYPTAAVVPLALLVLLDQTRLQPWVYQYCLLLIIIAASRGPRGGGLQSAEAALWASRLTVAALYFWGGVQKLNYSFGHEVLPQLLGPLRDHLRPGEAGLTALGLGVALVELLTGCGLLLRRTRRPSVCLALAMHALILGLLVGQGRNSVVWAWNAALMLAVLILFRRAGDGDAPPAPAPQGRPRERPSAGGRARAARALAVACAVLPATSLWGWWDSNLSGALYSGNTAVAALRVDRGVYERLPEAAKRQVFTAGGGELVLPLFEWAMAELNVPPYPEPRVFRRVAREVCRAAGDPEGVELIVRGRPAALDGRYVVTRAGCARLGP